jgi:hypothetical protein
MLRGVVSYVICWCATIFEIACISVVIVVLVSVKSF